LCRDLKWRARVFWGDEVDIVRLMWCSDEMMC
jgi:hypothetical protein